MAIDAPSVFLFIKYALNDAAVLLVAIYGGFGAPSKFLIFAHTACDIARCMAAKSVLRDARPLVILCFPPVISLMGWGSLIAFAGGERCPVSGGRYVVRPVSNFAVNINS